MTARQALAAGLTLAAVAAASPAFAHSGGSPGSASVETVRDLVVRDDLFDVLGADYHTLARIEAPGLTQQFAFTPETREARVTLDAPGGGSRGTGSFFLLGVEHILSGYDHLLFLLG